MKDVVGEAVGEHLGCTSQGSRTFAASAPVPGQGIRIIRTRLGSAKNQTSLATAERILLRTMQPCILRRGGDASGWAGEAGGAKKLSKE